MTVSLVAVSEEQHHSAFVAKIASAFVLGFSALFCCAIPFVVIRKWRKSSSGELGSTAQMCLDLMLRVGGGILIATTFLHLLPEVREGTEDLVKSNSLPEWPVQIPELVMCLGFFIMYFVEECAHIFLTKGKKHDHHEGGEKHSHNVTAGTPLRGILIVIALSVHQVFEGLAVGLEADDSKTVWMVTSAIAAHKLVIAICVGAEMASSKSTALTSIVCVGTFAVATPLGIGVGIGLSEGRGDDEVSMNIVSVILQGLATGTLLYVVFFEILTNNKEKGGLAYFFATAFGFILMLILVCCFKS